MYFLKKSTVRDQARLAAGGKVWTSAFYYTGSQVSYREFQD
jgi:hypothetical protein